MLVYYFVPFIVSNYLLFWVSNGHNSVTVQNRTHVYMNFFHHKDLGNHLLQLCPKVVKHPLYKHTHTHIYKYRLLRGRTLSEKLPKIRFWPSLIHQLRLLGSQQHPQIGVFLTSFSTWVTENSLAEINLKSGRGGVIKCSNIFGVKNWQTLAALWEGSTSVILKKSVLKLMDPTA